MVVIFVTSLLGETVAPCDAGLQVTGLSWNSNGTVLAISYGRIDVVGWCYDRGCVSYV